MRFSSSVFFCQLSEVMPFRCISVWMIPSAMRASNTSSQSFVSS
jgi:hypothetical protein